MKPPSAPCSGHTATVACSALPDNPSNSAQTAVFVTTPNVVDALPNVHVQVTLQHDTLEGVVAGNSYYGATIGRVCNRIAGASFSGRSPRTPTGSSSDPPPPVPQATSPVMYTPITSPIPSCFRRPCECADGCRVVSCAVRCVCLRADKLMVIFVSDVYLFIGCSVSHRLAHVHVSFELILSVRQPEIPYTPSRMRYRGLLYLI